MIAPQGIRSRAIPSIELPAGRYLSCAFGVSLDAAGQTRALLMRNRFLAAEGGVRPDVLSLGPTPDHEQRREILLERGLLNEQLGYRNIYEHYREHGWGEADATAELADLSAPHRRGDARRWRPRSSAAGSATRSSCAASTRTRARSCGAPAPSS